MTDLTGGSIAADTKADATADTDAEEGVGVLAGDLEAGEDITPESDKERSTKQSEAEEGAAVGADTEAARSMVAFLSSTKISRRRVTLRFNTGKYDSKIDYTNFKAWIRTKVSAGTGTPLADIRVVDLRKGSVMATVLLTTCPSVASNADLNAKIGTQFMMTKSDDEKRLKKAYGFPGVMVETAPNEEVMGHFEKELDRNDILIQSLREEIKKINSQKIEELQIQENRLSTEYGAAIRRDRIRLDRKLTQTQLYMKDEREKDIEEVNQAWMGYLDEQKAFFASEQEKAVSSVLSKLDMTRFRLQTLEQECNLKTATMQDDLTRSKQVLDEMISSRSMLLPFWMTKQSDGIIEGGIKSATPLSSGGMEPGILARYTPSSSTSTKPAPLNSTDIASISTKRKTRSSLVKGYGSTKSEAPAAVKTKGTGKLNRGLLSSYYASNLLNMADAGNAIQPPPSWW